MQFSTLYGRVIDYSQDETSTATTRAKAAINDALKRVASEKPWDILKRSNSISFSSTRSYDVTSVDSELNYVTSVWYINNGVREIIELVDDSRWEEVVDTDDTGTPKYCRNTYVSGSHRLELNVTPSSSFLSLYSTMYFEYQKLPDSLTNDTDTPEVPYPNQHMALVYFALSDISAHQGDRNAIPFWEGRAFKALTHAFKQDIKKKGRSLKIGKPMIPIYGNVSRAWVNEGEY